MDCDAIFNEEAPETGGPWPQNGMQYCEASIDRYRYVKSNITHILEPTQNIIPQNPKQKILINPNFGKKVFVNPNFNPDSKLPEKTTSSVIHVNTKIYNPKFLQANFNNDLVGNEKPSSPTNQVQKIHVNPNVIFKNAEYLNDVLQKRLLESEPSTFNAISEPQNSVISSSDPSNNVVKSKYKIIKAAPINKNVRSKYKLVKSPCVVKSTIKKRRNSVKSLYKIVKSSVPTTKRVPIRQKSKETTCLDNKYKIDNRIYFSVSSPSSSAIIEKTNGNKANKKRFVYINNFLSIGEVAKHAVIKKNLNLKMSITNIKIGGVAYKKSSHSLKRTFSSELNVGDTIKMGVKDMTKSNKYRLMRKNSATKLDTQKVGKAIVVRKTRRLSERSYTVKNFKIVRKQKRSVSPKKLKKCNIPCPVFRKNGNCRANDVGKCFRKHDPDQIALCTKFLQGACIKENCRLSHNVLAEKMPTCKYYLEGSCSKDNCQYLHVKISPKADICRDFIEGFCVNAAKCDRRHQYLCPDYEKYGKCSKQRCAYPHGKLVRNYFLENKNKFVKKHLSDRANTKKKVDDEGALKSLKVTVNTDSTKTMGTEVCKETKSRYYDEKETSQSNTENCTKNADFRSRPKLGELPAFIPFS